MTNQVIPAEAVEADTWEAFVDANYEWLFGRDAQ